MGYKISKYFTDSEVACKCGCGFNVIDPEVLKIADEVREHVGYPIVPSSACRCDEHNKAVGGAKTSQHVEGRAMDLPVKDPWGVYSWLCARYPDRYGFGVYNTFVHVDCRYNGPARWNKLS